MWCEHPGICGPSYWARAVFSGIRTYPRKIQLTTQPRPKKGWDEDKGPGGPITAQAPPPQPAPDTRHQEIRNYNDRAFDAGLPLSDENPDSPLYGTTGGNQEAARQAVRDRRRVHALITRGNDVRAEEGLRLLAEDPDDADYNSGSPARDQERARLAFAKRTGSPPPTPGLPSRRPTPRLRRPLPRKRARRATRRPATTPTRPPTTSRRGCPLNEAKRYLLRLADDISPLQEDPVIVGDKAKGHDGPCLAIMGTNCSVAIAYESSTATYYLGISAHGPANLDGNVARRLVRLRDAIERAME